MANNEKWNTEKIIQGLSRIPTSQAHLLVCMAILGGLMFVIGLILAVPKLKVNIDSVPQPLVQMLLGFACFTLFLPIPYVIYLAKELQKTKARIDKIEEKNN